MRGWSWLLLLGACQADPISTTWSESDLRPALEHPWFESHDLPELSLYAYTELGSEDPGPSFRGPYGTGNGLVFTLEGLTTPLNTLHNAVGPTYRKPGRFFGDMWAELVVDGEVVPFEQEWIGRPRGTGLIVTRADAGDVSLYTVDAALVGEQPIPAIGRWLLLATDSPHEVSIRFRSAQQLQEVPGGVADIISTSGAMLALMPWQGDLVGSELDFGVIDGQASASVAVVSAYSNAELASTVAALPEPDAALASTLAWWTEWSDTGVQVQTEDPQIADLYDGLRTSVRMQQSVAGGVSPMSRYTGVWLRDTIGPVRFFSRAGLFDEAHAAIEYMHLCHIANGDYGNSCSSGLTADDVGAPPDWSSLGTLSGRTAAEGPSYVPLSAVMYTRWSGNTELITTRWDWVRRGLMAQAITEDGLQTWAGDETFRFAMGYALDYPLEYGWQDVSWSANSSFLTAAASDALLPYATGADVDAIQARGDLARAALDSTFWQDGWWAPFVFHTRGPSNGADEVAPAPFEDVTLKAAWLGVFPPNDARLLDDLAMLSTTAGRGDGSFQTPPGQSLDVDIGADPSDGIATGMVPGYALAALTYVGDPLAADAFDQLHRYAGPSGQFPEDLGYANRAALQVLYDAGGAVGDVAARFRPWEGSINGDALLQWLVGAEPTPRGMALMPHLPNGNQTLAVSGITAADAVVDLTLEQDGHHLIATVTSRASSAFELALTVPVSQEPARVRAEVPSVVEQAPRGEWRVRLDPLELAPGESIRVEVRGAFP